MCFFWLLNQNTIRNREGSTVTTVDAHGVCTRYWASSQQGLHKSLSFSQGFPDDSDSKESTCNAGDPLSGWFLIRTLYQLVGTITSVPVVKVWVHYRAGWLIGDTGVH